MDNVDYNELFGLEAAAEAAEEAGALPEGARDGLQEDGAQAEGPGTADRDGDKAQESNEAQQAEEGTKGGEKPAAPGEAEQTPEERYRQAEERRSRERKYERVGRRAERDALSAVLARLGITDPKTGEPVDTVDKLEAYERKLSEQRLAEGKGNAEDIRRVVWEEIKAAGRAGGTAPSAAAEADPSGKEAEKAPAEADFQAEMAEIARMDPEMKNLNAVLKSEAGPKFREYVGRGLSFVEAYRLAAADRLAALRDAKAAEAIRTTKAAEAAQAKAAGKEHLSATRSQGQGALPVPDSEKEMFRVFFPDASDAEIQKMYNEDRKRLGK